MSSNSTLTSKSSTAPKNDYAYNASMPASDIFAILFACALAAHLFQTVKFRTMFMIVLVIGVAGELIGYVTRTISIKDPAPLWPIIVSTVGLIVAPAFMAAQAYMIVGRIMAYVGSEFALIKHTRITKIFVAADVLSILTQSGGGAMMGGANGDISKMHSARNILLCGLALQVITFGIFLFVAVAFDWRSSRSPMRKPQQSEMKRLRQLWIAFYATGVLITGRSIYRSIEFASISFTPGQKNPQGYIMTHEWVFYVFDSIPIITSVTLLSVYHVGRYLPNRKGLRIDGTYEGDPASIPGSTAELVGLSRA